MKHNLTLIILLFSLISINGYAQQGDNTKKILKKDHNLYEQPDLKSKIILEIKKGSEINLINSQKNFSKIKYKEKVGYVETPSIGSITTTNTSKKSSTSKTNSYSSTSKSKSSSKSYSSTCGARTKKGGYCKRKVSGGGYCYQHR